MAGQPMKRAQWQELEGLGAAELREQVFDRIEAGTSLAEIAKDLGVRRRFLCDWLEQPAQFAEYMRSRVRAASTLMENTLGIADEAEESLAALAKAKLRITTRQTIAKAWDRRTYGESGREVNVTLGLQHIAAVRQLSDQDETGETPPLIEAQAETIPETMTSTTETAGSTANTETKESLPEHAPVDDGRPPWA
jgi:transcriptional regulator with XRE-family HTH domain